MAELAESLHFQSKNWEELCIYSEFENCTFQGCNFAFANLNDIQFSECQFKDCDLSSVSLENTSLRDVQFSNSKLVGAHFNKCNTLLFFVDFEGCNLNYASFYQLKLKKTKFIKCQIKEADFSEADLTEADFSDSDLMDTVFDRTNLEKADFLTAFSYRIHPENNRIKKTKFAMPEVVGLLAHLDIHLKR